MINNEDISNNISEFGDLNSKGFLVYKIGGKANPVKTYCRKDFYKICIITGESLISYADKSIQIKGTTLFFGASRVPYAWKVLSPEQKGYTCLFTHEFFKVNNNSESLRNSPFFKIGGTPVFSLNIAQRKFVEDIFIRIINEYSTAYKYKYDLIRTNINLILHEAMKMEPTENFQHHKNAASRITSVFLELLERQFPVESPEAPLTLVSAQDFAEALAVHVNSLNRSVKKHTGKTTKEHIQERISAEAKTLLKNTNWNISEIAYSLGFEYPTYFNNFFKRMTNSTPSSFRQSAV